MHGFGRDDDGWDGDEVNETGVLGKGNEVGGVAGEDGAWTVAEGVEHGYCWDDGDRFELDGALGLVGNVGAANGDDFAGGFDAVEGV